MLSNQKFILHIQVLFVMTNCHVQENSWPTVVLTKRNIYLHHYFDYHICLSIRPSFVCSCVRPSQIFFSLKSPWNHPLTPVVDPWG